MRPSPGWFHLVRQPAQLRLAGRVVTPDDVLQLRLPGSQVLAVRLVPARGEVRASLRLGGPWELAPRGQERLPTELEGTLPLDAELRWPPGGRRAA